jgi:hypothetical protein
MVGIKDFHAIDTLQYLQLDGDRQFDTPQTTVRGTKQSCKSWRIVVVGGGGGVVVGREDEGQH